MATKTQCNWCGAEIVSGHYYVLLPNGRKVVLTATVKESDHNMWNPANVYTTYDLCLSCMLAFMVDCIQEEETDTAN